MDRVYGLEWHWMALGENTKRGEDVGNGWRGGNVFKPSSSVLA